MDHDNVTEYDEVDLEELRKTDEAVLVRVVEWGEWLPSAPSDTPSLPLHNGFTGFASGKTERLIDLLVSNTMQTKEVLVVDRDKVEETVVTYSYYVFQATLAQNITGNLLGGLLEVQRPTDKDEDAAKKKKSNLIVMQDGGLVTPNRAETKRANRLNGN